MPDRVASPPPENAAAPQDAEAFRRRAWQRYRAAARAFALHPDDRRAVEDLESASSGLRRAAAVIAWRQGATRTDRQADRQGG
jgi:hypothetical protein